MAQIVFLGDERGNTGIGLGIRTRLKLPKFEPLIIHSSKDFFAAAKEVLPRIIILQYNFLKESHRLKVTTFARGHNIPLVVLMAHRADARQKVAQAYGDGASAVYFYGFQKRQREFGDLLRRIKEVLCTA